MPVFSSKHPCSCGLTCNDHETVFESREERVAEGREVDPKWMQETNMIGGSGGLSSFTGLVSGAEMDEMRDPNSIMQNVQNSIGGYAALHALEGEPVEESKHGYGPGTVAKTKASAAPTKSAYDLFHTPHSLGTKAIGGPAKGVRKGVASIKYR